MARGKKSSKKTKSKKGKSALIEELAAAASVGNQERCQHLLSQEADVNGTDKKVQNDMLMIRYNLHVCECDMKP